MKISAPKSVLFMLVLSVTASLIAADAVRLETNVYVFKQSDFSTIKIPGAPGTNDRHGVAFSDGVAQFDEDSLSLEGPQFNWSGGQNPPNRFSLIGVPSTSLVPGKQFTLLSSVPVQYVEKRGDGTLKVREIPADSPEAPHFRMTFTLQPQPAANKDLRVTCLLDIATIVSRTKVSGVALEVGKPVLAQFNDKIDLTLRAAEWTAFALRAPNGSDYNLLMLLKATPESAAALASEQKETRYMTAEEIAQFATFYYQHPQPELIGRVLESLGPSKFFPLRQYTADELHRAFKGIGFFAEVFAANPNRVAEWRKILDGTEENRETRFWLQLASDPKRSNVLLNLQATGATNGLTFVAPDLLWGGFFATGNPEFLRKLVSRLDYASDDGGLHLKEAADIMVSFAYNAPHHPLIRQTLEESRKKANRYTRGVIDDVLEKDLVTIRRKAHALASDAYMAPRYHELNEGVNPWGISAPTLSPMLQHAGDNAAQQNAPSNSSR